MLTRFAEPSFGQLLKLFRLRSGLHRLSDFSEILFLSGLDLSNSELSRWQTDQRLPKDRRTLLVVVRTLATAGGLKFIGEANQLLEAAGQGNLTAHELFDLFTQTSILVENACSRGIDRDCLADYQLRIKLNLSLTAPMEKYLSLISQKYNKTKALVIRELIDGQIAAEQALQVKN